MGSPKKSDSPTCLYVSLPVTSRGLKEGTKSIEVDQLAVARQTIEELEVELAAVKTASAPAALFFRRGRAIPDPALPRTNGEPSR